LFFVECSGAKRYVGCVTNPHGVKGLENCHFLKSIDDARKIKNQVLDNMELACLPTTSDEERKRLLSFVVCGGGPTGVEFASELFDLLNEDLLYSFPRILRNEISVHIIQSRSHILNTYDEALSKFAEVRQLVALILKHFTNGNSLGLRAMTLMS
jgi:NADH dehydrogenase